MSNITVTPKSPPSGREVDCDFSGGSVDDDAIFLKLNQPYDLVFTLASGSGYTFGPDPFFSQPKRCPTDKGSAKKPYSVTSNNGTSITVHVDPVPKRAVTHFRLNFDNGYFCDPIIVHD